MLLWWILICMKGLKGLRLHGMIRLRFDLTVVYI
jgi:hypothetical protein